MLRSKRLMKSDIDSIVTELMQRYQFLYTKTISSKGTRGKVFMITVGDPELSEIMRDVYPLGQTGFAFLQIIRGKYRSFYINKTYYFGCEDIADKFGYLLNAEVSDIVDPTEDGVHSTFAVHKIDLVATLEAAKKAILDAIVIYENYGRIHVN